jgi:hypothetical protein
MSEYEFQLHDDPSPLEIIAEVRGFLATELLPSTEGRVRYMVMVAVNALKIAERQLKLGPQQELDHQSRLKSLGVESDRQLAEMIRDGDLRVPRSQILDTVFLDVLDKISVVNPGYLESGIDDETSDLGSVQ